METETKSQNILWEESEVLGNKWPRAFIMNGKGEKEEIAFIYAEDGRPYEERYSCRPHLGFKINIVVRVKTDKGPVWKKLAAMVTSVRHARIVVSKVFARHPEWF
jgi:hypothetical protein